MSGAEHAGRTALPGTMAGSNRFGFFAGKLALTYHVNESLGTTLFESAVADSTR